MAQTINLNIIPKGIPDVVNVSQFDIGRTIQFNLYEGAQIYTIPAGATAVIAGRKGDNHIFIYEATIAEGRHAVSIETTEQMTAWAGENLCQLRITKTGIDIATVNFRMMVQERPDANGDISDSDLPMIIALATEQELNAEAWAVGTKDGTPVASADPQYHNNSKYYKEQAATSATNAANSATAAAGSADHADATAADVDEAVQAVEGVVDTTYGMQDSLSIDVDGNPIEGNFAAGVADKLIVDIEPTQDLHGQSYPYVGGAGKNKLPYTVSGLKSANPGTWSENTYTLAGMTYTIMTDDGNNVIGIDIDGTTSTYPTFNSPTFKLPVDYYKFVPSMRARLFKGSTLVLDTSSVTIFTVDSEDDDYSVALFTGSGTVSHKIAKPMIIKASETDTTFAPYTNNCPISGTTEEGLDIEGKNKCPIEKFATSGNSFSLKADSYTFSFRRLGSPKYSTSKIKLEDSDDNNIVSIPFSGVPIGGYFVATFTLTETTSCHILNENVNVDSSGYAIDNIQIEKGNERTNYTPYEIPHNSTIDLEGTRYGVTLDVKSGVLTVNKILVNLDTLNWEVADSHTLKVSGLTAAAFTAQNVKVDAICSCYYVSDQYHAPNNKPCISFNSSTQVYILDNTYDFTTTSDAQQYLSGQTLCYKLAVPTTVQLDPVSLNLFKGYNYIAASGNTIIHLSAVPEKLINYIVNAFGTDESGRTTASRAYAAKEYFYKDGFMYKVTSAIAQNAAFTEGTNCVQTTIFAELTALNA